MRKLTLLLCALLCLPAFAQAPQGFVTFTGTKILDPAGNPASGATISLRVALPQGTPLSLQINGGGRTTKNSVFAAVGGGAFSMNAPNTLINYPNNACLVISVTDDLTGSEILSNPCVQVNPTWCTTSGGNTTCNYDNYQEPAVPMALIAPGPQGLQGAQGAQGPQGPPGTLTNAGAVKITGAPPIATSSSPNAGAVQTVSPMDVIPVGISTPNGVIVQQEGRSFASNAPCYSHGNNGKTPQQGWCVLNQNALSLIYRGEGIHGGRFEQQVCAGVSDCHTVYSYTYCYGGRTAASDEGCQPGMAATGGEADGTYTGTLSGTPGANALTVKLNCTSDCAYPGVGRYLVESLGPTPTRDFMTSFVANGGETPSVIGVNSPQTVSTMWGTLAGDVLVNVPSDATRGDPTTWDQKSVVVYVAGGVGAKIGELACFAGQTLEASRITGISGAPSGGIQTITLPLKDSHYGASWVFTGGPCGLGIDFDANISDNLHYPTPVLGAVDANHVWATVPKLSVTSPFLLGKVHYKSWNTEAGLNAITRVNNVVTIGPYNSQGPPNTLGDFIGVNNHWMSEPTIRIANSPTAALNGLATNCTSAALGSISCTMPGADASDYTQTATVTAGTNGVGTTDFEWVAMAKVVDVRDLTQPASYVDGNGKLQEPQIDGTFHLAPNILPNYAGAVVREDHWVTDQIQGIKSAVIVHRPQEGMAHSQGTFSCTGAGCSEVPGITISNPDAKLGQGVTSREGVLMTDRVRYGFKLQYAPDYNQAAIQVGCPYTVNLCQDPTYHYPVFDLAGNGGNFRPDWNPLTATYSQVIKNGNGNLINGVKYQGITQLIQTGNSFKLFATDYSASHSIAVSPQGVQIDGVNVAPIVLRGVNLSSSTSDTLSIAGLTANSECYFVNRSAAAASGGLYVSGNAAGSITITHAATSGITVDVVCPVN